MFEVLILIPVADNDGDRFPREAHETFEAILVARFGGFTRYPGSAVGGWENEGRVYLDRTYVYAVAVSSLSRGGDVADVAVVAKAHYRQEAIFIRYLGIVEII